MRDIRFIHFVITVLVLCTFDTNAYGVYVDTFVRLERVELNENLVVSDNGIYNVHQTDVGRSVSISNRGVINSDFYVGDDARVYVTNSGTINGQFHVASNSKLIQVVRSPDDITHIDVDKNFNVLVANAKDVSWSDVLNIGGGADKITLDDSILALDCAPQRRFNSGDATIEIVGDVTFLLDSADGVDYSVPALRNVSGTGSVSFDVANINPLYKIIPDVNQRDLYMKLVRETNYARVFNNNVGTFLDDLRRYYPDDKLLNAMDSARDMDTINSIMADSVRLNPVNLMAPVRQMHRFDALGRWRYSDANNVNAAADVIFSDVSSMYRANVAVAGAVARNVYAAVDGYVGAFDVSDDINDYSGRVYGAKLKMHYDDGLIVGNLSGGVSRADFVADYVFDGSAAVNNPSGTSGDAAMDIGAYLVRYNDLAIAPFVGAITDYVSVLNESDTTVVANCGVDITFADHDFDIMYDYGFRGNILTDGTQYVGAFVKFTAPDDDIGGELNTAIVHDEYSTGYQISMSAHMMF